MARRTDDNRIKEIASYIERHPGIKPAEIARVLEVPRSSITRALPSLEDTCYLVSEDRRGGLWPFRK